MTDLPPPTWALLIFGWFAASVAYRLVSGKGLLARPRPDAVFVERWASGRSGTGLLSRLSTARNCLQIQVTANDLIVTPQFPFSIGFMPEIYDLDKRIDVKSIRKAAILGGRFAQAIEVTYTRRDGGPDTLQLLLRRGESFRDRLLAARDGAA